MVAPVRWDPVGWAPRGGYKGEDPTKMGTREWVPTSKGVGSEGGPQGVGSRWVWLRGVGPWLRGTRVGPMLMSPRLAPGGGVGWAQGGGYQRLGPKGMGTRG